MVLEEKSKRMNRNKKPKPVFFISLLTLSLLTFSIYLLSPRPGPVPEFDSSKFPKYPRHPLNDKYLWYAPHSGFSNQLSELKNGIIVSVILNRTLVIPPVLDHHAVALGSCPKFRVLDPPHLRLRVWDHLIQLVRYGRYVSMADVIDLSSVSNVVRTIDFSDFVSLWCGIDLDSVCAGDANTSPSSLNDLKHCGLFLSGFNGNVDKCLYAVDVDCRTTVWTYQENDSDGTLDSYQPDEQLRIKKKMSFVRRRQDVLKHLGPGSEPHLSTLLAFGSLFTGPYKGSQSYIDIRESLSDNRIQSLLNTVEFLPFVPVIRNAGKEFAEKKIQSSFLCAQLRLLDGQFKNHREATFSGLKQKVESLKQKGSLPVNIFVMTDLPRSNWSNSYLGDLASDTTSFKVHILNEEDQIVKRTAGTIASSHNTRFKHCPHTPLDLLLYIEEAICSCASLGFVGTAGSTIAESVELMRKNSFC